MGLFAMRLMTPGDATRVTRALLMGIVES
jgi:hypothetical protein